MTESFLRKFFIFSTVMSTALSAGTNSGFSAKIGGPISIRNPEIGTIIEIPVIVEKVRKAKGGLLTAHYDPNLLEFVEFPRGVSFIPGLLTLPGTPTLGDDGFNLVKGGGTQLTGTPAEGRGLLGIMSFRLKKALTEKTFISIVDVQINVSSKDRDNLVFPIGKFGVAIQPVFSNQIFDLEIVRGDRGASVNWRTKEAGLTDTLRVRASDNDQWQIFTNPLSGLLRERPLLQKAIEKLLRLDIIPRFERDDDRIRNALLPEPEFKDAIINKEFIAALRVIDGALGDRRHVIPIKNLEPNTKYIYEAESYSLKNRKSQPVKGEFKTRIGVDKRPMFIERFDVKSTPVSAVIRWFTNRPADTRYTFNYDDGEVPLEIVQDEEGTQVHKVEISDLQPGTKYEFTVGSRLTDAETLLNEGLKEHDIEINKTGFIKTQRAGRGLRFIGPPSPVVGSDNARLRIRLNQPAALLLEYGATNGNEPLREIPVVYTDSTRIEELLTEHDITLNDLESATRYRFRLNVYNSSDTLTTDPSGNKPWSRDFSLRTSAASDTLDPVITQGPQVDVRGNIAIVRFSTDVPTKASVYVGAIDNSLSNSGIGSLGTADEVEIPSLTPNGGRRFARRHVLTIPALDLSTAYGYRIEVEGTNGRTLAFDPNNSLGSNASEKRVRILQPPGGSGSFITESTVDTQFPVILSGPTVTSTTDNSAVIEWTTDEPANSDVQFGTDSLDESELSGDAETNHKIILSDLESGIAYKYMVASTDAAGNGATESATATFTTNPEIDITAPELVSEPEIVYKNDDSATIMWTTNEEATGEIEFGLSTELGTIRSLSTTSKTHEATLANLEAETTYHYSVSAYDLSNNGPSYSDTISFTTDNLPDLNSPVISSIQSLVSDSSAVIAWETDEVADSFVEFGTDSLQMNFNVGNTEDVKEHSITLTGLDPNTEYFYVVGSTDRADNPFTESEILNFTTSAGADVTAPTAPSNLSITASATQILLSWSAPNDLDLNGFNIYRKTNNADYAVVLSGTQSTIYSDLNAEEGVTYQYYVTAIDNQTPPNESNPSTTLAANLDASASPSIPSELGTTGELVAPTFYFTNATPYNVAGILTYNIQVSTTSDFSDVTSTVSNLVENSGEIGTGQTSWTIDRDLEEGRTYFWRVRAIEGDLVGPFSDAAEYEAVDTSLMGDFNDSGKVDFDDFFLFVEVFGQAGEGDVAAYDLDDSGTVDLSDFFLFVDNFGKSVSGKRWLASSKKDDRAMFLLEASGGTRAEKQQVLVNLLARNVNNLKAFGSIVEYDPQVLRFDTAKPGVGHLLHSAGGRAPLFAIISKRPGQIVVVNGLVDNSEVSGDGLLAELRFTLIGRANDVAINLEETYILSSHLGVRNVTQLESTQLLPNYYALHTNFPNPFNPSTTIEYTLPEPSSVELLIYNGLGQQVRVLTVQGRQAAGFYSITWDGLDDNGFEIASGLYFCKLYTPRFTQIQKMTLVK